ncbi:OB-fold tRNA/helicase-type nucleic acid binding-protein [Paenibacillus alvei]|uniref:OB-fold tRNA/helicase-type nucleic acid binding-protein n=2 Tax=Paenibacillus alvei TaxID=44250 RepID=A0A383RAX6_PAEAL|nr:OB-fold tRNA/helicase-type nucleic acid binding-protein [Paenibacillus alvei]
MNMLTMLKRKWFKVVLAALIALPTLSLGAGSSAYAEGPADPAPYITAKGTPNGKKVLFDNTHGQTAGAADWVIDGGFSDFANGIADKGYEVKELRKSTPITYDDLKDYQVFVIGEANIPYKTSEQAAMLQYVNSGGSIFFIADHYNADRNKNRWDASEAFNGYRRGAWNNPAQGMGTEEANSASMQDVASSDWLSDNFGVRIRYNALGDINANVIVNPQQAFGITNQVSSVAMHAGSTIAVTNPQIAKGIVYLPAVSSSQKWPNAVDQGVYNGGGVAEGTYVSISKVGLGKAAVIGDSSPVEDATPKYLREENGQTKKTYDGYKEQDDAVLLMNLIDWLAEQESYTSFAQVPGLQLDTPTALLPFETPQLSTEPQPEPWAAPAAGYKWWDSSTFKKGSYGAPSGGQNPSGNPAMTHPATVTAATPFNVTITAGGLTPNSSITLQIGVYLTGGQQVGQVQQDNGSWPTGYGYNSFTLTADSTGTAVKTIQVRTQSGKSGAANIRLRKDSSNVYQTNPITIAP